MPPASATIQARITDNRYDKAIFITPGTDIQSVVADAPAQSMFVIQAGIHRLQHITPRDGDIFIGESGSVLNGALLIENIRFDAESSYWIATHPQLTNMSPVSGGECRPAFPRCNHAYDLYLDDVPLLHVDSISAVQPGTWFFDYDTDRLIIGSNPAERLVELSQVFHAFQGTASNVIIHNLTIEKYGGYGQIGAIRGQDSTNWVITGNTVRLNSGAGITFGDGTQIIDNRVVYNGQIGISGEGDNVLVQFNEIAKNNYAGYNPAWEAGGTKFVATEGLIVRANYVHQNNGPGLWTDIDNIHTRYEHNLVVNNQGAGILHEISYNAIIRDNIVRYNQNQDVSVYLGGQIALSSSGNVDIIHNDVVTGRDGGNAIVVIQQERGTGQYGTYEARDNRIQDNQIVFLNTTGEMAAATDIADADWFWQSNDFLRNEYYGLRDDLQLWGWRDATMDWNTFQQQTGTTGNYSTDIPLQAIVSPSWQSVQRQATNASQ
jgi:hypothetical protein